MKNLKEIIDKKMKNDEFHEAFNGYEKEFQIAQQIIKFRKKVGMTQSELAKKAKTSQSAIARLESNIEKACFVKESKVIRANAFKIGTAGVPADLLFVDPPYIASRDVAEGSQMAKLLDLLSAQTAEGAIVVVRTHADVILLEQYEKLTIIDRRRWGTMAIAILQRTK